MTCQKCRKDSPPDAAFCPYCGKKLVPTKKSRAKSRGNGTGTAFKRGSTWTAQVVVGYEDLPPFDPANPDNKMPRKKITRSKGGFKTREAALLYCPTLKAGPVKPKTAPALKYYWDNYEKNELTKLSDSKQTAYSIAWNKLSKLHDVQVDQLTVSDLRDEVAKVCTTWNQSVVPCPVLTVAS